MRIEIGFSARKGDFDGALAHLVDFVEIWRHIFGRQIDEMICRRGAFDVAIGAFNIALRSRVKPQRIQFLEEDLRALLAFGGDARVFEFFGIKDDGHARHIALE